MGIRQVVILGAGFDSRCWRLTWPQDCRVFELDRPAVLAKKRELLAGLAPVAERHEIACDLTEPWEIGLSAEGWRPEPTVWVVEGVLIYLLADQARDLLRAIERMSPNGSRLLVDVIGTALLHHPALDAARRELTARGMPWRFSTDRPEELVDTACWASKGMSMAEVGYRYGRWPGPPPATGPQPQPTSYLVAAVKR